MKKRMRGKLERAGWALLAGTLGMVNPALAQHYPSPAGGERVHQTSILKPGTAAVVSEDGARLEEMKVELAWLANPSTFPYQLVARANSRVMEVHGYLPNESVQILALQLAKEHTVLPLATGLKVHPSLATRVTGIPAEDLQKSAADLLAEAFPQQIAGFTIRAQANGQVTVAGSVPSHEEKLAVSRRLRRLQGCTCVDNQLTVPTVVRDGVPHVLVSADGMRLVPAEGRIIASSPRPLIETAPAPSKTSIASTQVSSPAKLVATSTPTKPSIAIGQPTGRLATAPKDRGTTVQVPSISTQGTSSAAKPIVATSMQTPAKPSLASVSSDKKDSKAPVVGATATPFDAPATTYKPAAPAVLSPTLTTGPAVSQPSTTTTTKPMPLKIVAQPSKISDSSPSLDRKDTMPSISSASTTPAAGSMGSSMKPSAPLPVLEKKERVAPPVSTAMTTPKPAAPLPTLEKKEQAVPSISPSTSAPKQSAPSTSASTTPNSLPLAVSASLSSALPTVNPPAKPTTVAGATTPKTPTPLPSEKKETAQPLPQTLSANQPGAVTVASMNPKPAALTGSPPPAKPSAPAPVEKKAPAASDVPYVTTGVVTFMDAEPEAASTAAISPALLKQRIASVCGRDAKGVEVVVKSGTVLQVQVTTRRADVCERLAQKVLEMPELGPFQVDLQMQVVP